MTAFKNVIQWCFTISQYLIVSRKSYQFGVPPVDLEWFSTCEDIVSDTTNQICVKF